MKYIVKVLSAVILAILVLFIFRSWFTHGLLAGGDFQVYYKEMFHNFSFFPPPAWNWTLGAGLGVNGSSLLWNYIVVQLPIVFFGNLLGFDWPQIQRLGYLYPYLILSIVLPYCYAKKLFSSPYAILGTLLFSFNTYILMLIGGGQIFLSLAYVLIPPVFYYFYKLLTGGNKTTQVLVETICLCALFFSLQALFDIRIAYVTLVLVFLFACINLVFNKKFKNILFLPLVLFISGLLHAFWVLPTVIVRENLLSGFGAEYTNIGMVKFLSFANFSNSISLLHPNWPENIFGKIYFMRPEFLILPVLTFSSLLFIKHEKKYLKELVLFFTTLALVGSFLAKGVSDPFGEIYLWMFNNIPGFVMFRDPTKWYALVAVSCSFLIPYSIFKIYNLVASVKKFKNTNLQYAFFIFVSFYILFLIRPAWLGQLGGTFKSVQIPYEYLNLEQFLAKDKNFYRTFWIPRASAFSFYSHTHPIVVGTEFTRAYTAQGVINYLRAKNSEQVLKAMSVRYVVVPDDTQGNIFLKDRKYDISQYNTVIAGLKKITWLKQKSGFGKIGVFEIINQKDHFWSPSEDIKIIYKFINPTKYEVDIQNAKKGDIMVFSESYDAKWIAGTVSSTKYDGIFNSFILEKNGNYVSEVYYYPQVLVSIGMIISVFTLIFVLSILLFGYRFKKW